MSRRRAARQRVELAPPAASRLEASLRANLPAQAGGRVHGQSDCRAAAARGGIRMKPAREQQPASADASLTSDAASVELQSSARLLTPPRAGPSPRPNPPSVPHPELVAMPPRPHPENFAPIPGRDAALLPRATGAPKPGNGNANANCAPSRIVPTSPRAAAPAPDRMKEREARYVDGSGYCISGVASAARHEAGSRRLPPMPD